MQKGFIFPAVLTTLPYILLQLKMLVIVNLTIFQYIGLITSCLIQAGMQGQNSKMKGI